MYTEPSLHLERVEDMETSGNDSFRYGRLFQVRESPY